MNRVAMGCLTTLLVLALLVSIGFNILQSVELAGSEGAAGEKRDPLDELLEAPGTPGVTDKIAQIDLEGLITSAGSDSGLLGGALPRLDLIKQALEQAVADERVKAVLLRIHSPGGEVTASDILHAAVRRAAAKKPVVVYMDAVAASGGYYVACGASKIVASETTLTGSIGVLMESFSYHGLLEKVGLGARTFTSGAFKDTLSGARPMREEEAAYVQGLINEMYERFLRVVAEARGKTPEQLRTTVADGRIFTGAQALKEGLVDRVGYLEDAWDLARELGHAPGARVVKYRSNPGLLTLLGLATARAAGPLKVELAGGLTGAVRPGLLYYLPAWLVR
jgi:protease-4